MGIIKEKNILRITCKDAVLGIEFLRIFYAGIDPQQLGVVLVNYVITTMRLFRRVGGHDMLVCPWTGHLSAYSFMIQMMVILRSYMYLSQL